METTTIEAAAIAASSTATLKFQRKCSGRWTTRTSSNFPSSAHQPHHHHSNKTRSHRGVARASAGLSSRVKLRSWMAEPLVVKDGDASLRLVTDLPRFNWLELKLSSSSSSNKQSSTPATARPEVTKQSSITKKETGTERTSNSAPLKVRILEMNKFPSSGSSLNNARRPMETGCDDASQQKTAPAQQVKDELQITTTTPVALPEQSICRWPLKKRLIVRQEETPTTPPSPISPGSTESKVTYSPLAQRGPVIMRNVILPPTPPASSAPPDLPPLLIQADDMSTPIEEVQEGPLDLSSNERCCPPSEPLLLPIKRRPSQQEDNGRAEVEIIAMTTRTRPPVSVMPSGSSSAFHPPLPIQNHSSTAPPLIPRCHAPLATEIHGARMERKPVARSIQRVPAIRPSPFPPPESRPSRSSLNGRPFPLPPLRPLPQHWKQVQTHQMQQQHHRSPQLLPSVPIIRPDVQLHPVCPPPPPPPPRPRTSGAHPHPQQPQMQPHPQQHQLHVQQPHLHQQQQMQHFPRFFHPQQVMGYSNMVIKKPANIPLPVSVPTTQPSQTSSAFPSDWSLRSCVVCSRRADFRCAGCHGNAYCSTLCQVTAILLSHIDRYEMTFSSRALNTATGSTSYILVGQDFVELVQSSS